MAFAGIAPVRNVDTAIGAGDKVHTSKPRVGHEAKVRSTLANITRPLPLEKIAVDSESMQIESVKAIAKFFRPVVPLVDHQTDMGMATAEV